MALSAGADIDRPSHHILLTDRDSNQLGLIISDSEGKENPLGLKRNPTPRSALKMSQGGGEYEDFVEPYSSRMQKDWSGGMGMDDLEDYTRYQHAFMINTAVKNKIMLAGRPTITTGYVNQDLDFYRNTDFVDVDGANRYWARKFPASVTYDPDFVWLHFKYTGAIGTELLTVRVCDDDAGGSKPGTVQETVTISLYGEGGAGDIEPWAHSLVSVPLAVPLSSTSFVATTNYWIEVIGPASPPTGAHWRVGGNPDAATNSKVSSDGSTYGAAPMDLLFRFFETLSDGNVASELFDYRGLKYALRNPSTGGAPSLWHNGYRGVATGGQDSTWLADTNRSWAANALVGSIVKIVEGPGKGEWKKITWNTATVCTIGGSWKVTPVAGQSEYVIVAVDWWTEITGHGLTAPVTDIFMSSEDVCYFCQGDDATYRRMIYDKTTDAHIFDDDGGANYAVHMVEVPESNDDGDAVQRIYRTENKGGAVASFADVQAWGVDLSWGDDIVCGKKHTLITNLDYYGAPPRPWVFKEDIVGEIVDKQFQPIPLREMEAVASSDNARTTLVHNLFLYFNMLRGGFERFYQQNLDDMGPNRDDGLQAGYSGPITAAVGYPGMFYIGISADEWGNVSTSSVTLYNGGWHHQYRAPVGNWDILSLEIEAIPGATLDRLWVSVGQDIVWLPIPSDTRDPAQDPNYPFYHEGMINLSSQYFDYKDLTKFFDKLRIFCEDLSGSDQFVTGTYDIYDDTGAHELTYVSYRYGAIDFSVVSPDGHNAGLGGRIKVNLVLHTIDGSKSPKIKAVRWDALIFQEVKYRYDCTIRIMDNGKDLLDQAEVLDTVEAYHTRLEDWIGYPLTMNCAWGPWDGDTVFIDPHVLEPFEKIMDKDMEKYVGPIGFFQK